MDDDAAYADAAQQQHVLRQRLVDRLVDRVAAEFDDDGLARELADIGERFDEDARSVGGRQARNRLGKGMHIGHEVTLFSLI